MDRSWTSGLRATFKHKVKEKGLDLDDATLKMEVLTALEKAFTCRTCELLATYCEEATNYGPGTCLLMHCRNRKRPGLKCSNWYVCVSCKCFVDKRRTDDHFKSNLHMRKLKAVTFEANVLMENQEDVQQPPQVITEEAISVASPVTATTTIMAASSSEVSMATRETAPSAHSPSVLERLFSEAEQAPLGALMSSFGDQSLMKLYHVADFAKPKGGVRYLVSRMFHKTDILFEEQMASEREAIWHFQSFLQYCSSSDKQRRRQSQITSSLVASVGNRVESSLFQRTRVLQYKELNRYYGKSNQHTLWNILPVPTVDNIGGIAYVSPVNAIRYLFAFGTEVDDSLNVTFQQGDSDSSNHEDSVVVHINQSKAAHQWKQSVSETEQDGLQGHLTTLLAWAQDWRDGFGANRTKQNRKSTDLWTFSVGTPKRRINSLSNTLPIALGLKKNPHWADVEHQFRRDMKRLHNGLKPIMVYHGGLRKVIPVCIRRIACLTDKVERADYTSTLSCTSKYHRWFGKILKFDAPTFDVAGLEERLLAQKQGNSDNELRQFGWSAQYVHLTANGGVFPSCYNCRKRAVEALRLPFIASDDENQCDVCGNWMLSEETKERLSFLPPKNYPVTQIPNCPVTPPAGREVGLERLQGMDVQFPTMVQATKFAFANSMTKRGQGWNKTHCVAYLRSNGINGKHQDLIYEHAKQAYNQQLQIDWNDEERVGGYRIPAAWNGDLAIRAFVEMLMHLLFLGVAESNFKLCNKYLPHVGRPVETFKKAVNVLLKDLTGFNLSWLLVLPFSGSTKTKLTTGTWVSENWLGWVRISKVVYAYCSKKGIEDERLGSNDVSRMVASFTAMVARILSHSGFKQSDIVRLDYLVKEFLSSVRELDIRVRYKTMHSLGASTRGDAVEPAVFGVGEEKSRDQWWLKSNYISCLNLKAATDLLGPLTNFWDGGGRGEKYIQKVKSEIPRGIREGGRFFVRLHEKVYKLDAMERIENACCVSDVIDLTGEDTKTLASDSLDESESEVSRLETNSVASQHPPLSTIAVTTEATDEPDSDLEVGDDEPLPTEEEERWSTPMEDEQMKKARTYCVYKTRAILQESIDSNKPVSGILLRADDGTAVMYAVYRKPKKCFGWMKASFEDAAGVSVCGMWCSPMVFTEADLPPSSMENITELAKMATMAIPLHYTLGHNHDHGNKYCVITNWWRERNSHGRYVFPTLAYDLYLCENRQEANAGAAP